MYGKIPKISPGAYIFQRIFLSRAYFWRGFIYSGGGGCLYTEGNLCFKIGLAYTWREICVSKSIGLAYWWKEIALMSRYSN